MRLISNGPFSLTSPTPTGRRAAMTKAAVAPLEHLLHLDRLNRQFAALPRDHDVSVFLRAALAAVQRAVEVPAGDLQRLPAGGPCVVVANRPGSFAEVLALAEAVARVRPDLRLLAAGPLASRAELSSLVIPLRGDPIADAAAGQSALDWLAGGGVLIAFPAVRPKFKQTWRHSEPPWRPELVALIKHAGVPVVPARISGTTSQRYRLAGLLHPLFQLAATPRELQRQRSTAVTVRLGHIISAERLRAYDAAAAAHYLCLRSSVLGAGRGDGKAAAEPPKLTPLIAPLPPAELAAEIATLPREQLLIEAHGRQVWYADGDQIPALLRELGRLRELSFREVGEGTGEACNLDCFDLTYVHLFEWDAAARAVVGAYRLGRTDQLRAHGDAAIYTTQLFHFAPGFFETLGPALELGRSFVQPAYQRDYHALRLLWQGIGQLLLRWPQYRKLVGAVSVSSAYSVAARELIALALGNDDRRLQPRRPIGMDTLRHLDVAALRRLGQDLDELDDWVADLELEDRGLPVLVRQYAKLGAEFLSFNVDPDFCDSLDGYIVVDLLQADARWLSRLLGRDIVAALRQPG